MPSKLTSKIRRGVVVGGTTLRWRSRLGRLGARVVLERPRECRTPESIVLGDRTVLSGGWWLTDLEPESATEPRIRLGADCRFLYDLQINSAASVTIGDGVLGASRVFITDCDHRVGDATTPTTKVTELSAEPVVIGDNCWLGQNAVVLKGVTLGERCIVAANSVVTKSFPDGSIIGGVPGKLLGHVDE
ncbi:MAG: acyltransferase [Actinomycetota bacterium]